jgi:hypothetical protein
MDVAAVDVAELEHGFDDIGRRGDIGDVLMDLLFLGGEGQSEEQEEREQRENAEA